MAGMFCQGVAVIPFDRIQGVQTSNLRLRGIVNNSCWRSVLYNLASLLSHWVLLRLSLSQSGPLLSPFDSCGVSAWALCQ